MSDLKIANARLEARIANTERRANELRDRVTRLDGELARIAEKKGEEKDEPKPKARPAPQEALVTGPNNYKSQARANSPSSSAPRLASRIHKPWRQKKAATARSASAAAAH
ncbi:MAG: hypothetical protein WCA32_04405 [Chromatiaceae bacterium]